ncbi:facilitated trehalose transporter Tret1-like [Rhodnius prolixus]|uniref:facilitated trehalose transporter Tret1-like n=1 Tax=Rhodnius prolixus TaxID=13249 RepID=UPI003D187923
MKARTLGIIRQVIASIVLSISLIIFGNMVGWPSPVLFEIREHGRPMNLTKMEQSLMVSIIYLGNLISPLPMGYLMDMIGRKTAILSLSVVPIISWTLLMFARDVIRLCIGRFLAGIWAGTVITIGPLYLAEIAEPKLRGALSTFVQLNVGIGTMFAYVVGSYVNYDQLAALSNVFSFIFILLFWNMPESPYWLTMKDRDEEAALSLAWLRGEHVHVTRVDMSIMELSLGVHEEMQHPRNFKDLVATKGHRKALIIVQVLAMAQRWSGISSILAFMSITIPERNYGQLTVNHCVMVFGGLLVLFVLLSTYFVDCWGRKPLLLTSSIGCSLGTFLVGLWFYLDDQTNLDVSDYYWTPFGGMLIYIVFFSIGLGPIPTTEQGELFSANDRALASALTSMTLALSSFICNLIYLPIAECFGMFVNYLIFTVVSIGTAVFVKTYTIETKSKTLHEIHQELDKNNDPTGKEMYP